MQTDIGSVPDSGDERIDALKQRRIAEHEADNFMPERRRLRLGPFELSSDLSQFLKGGVKKISPESYPLC
jgi:hypothetical protein